MVKFEYGRLIGSFLGKPVYESFKELEQGAQYVFDRMAQCDADGCPLSQVRKDELLLPPGLIYRKAV